MEPHIVTAILLTTFPVLYFTSPWLFRNYQFVLVNFFAFFTQPPNTPLLWQPSTYSLYLWVCFWSACSFVLFFRFHIWHLFHSAQCPVGSPMLLLMARFHFHGWVIYPYTHVPHLLYSLVYWCALRLLPYIGHCK